MRHASSPSAAASGGVPPDEAVEFSRRVRLEEVTDGGLERTIEADAAERAALARRFNLEALHHLTANLGLFPTAQGMLLEGSLTAEVEQSCVVTLEPLKSAVASRFTVRYISPRIEVSDTEGEELDPMGEDVEPLPADVIDIGEVVAQYLSLAIDPYPRKAGADVTHPLIGEEAPPEPLPRSSPFAVLKKLQNKG